jgi:hypothetical protein
MAKTEIGHTLPFRVLWAALWRANGIGHAEFEPDELRKLLVTKDGEPSGESVTATAVRRARELRLVEEGSTVRCLIVSQHLYRRRGRTSMRCGTHHIGPLR